jgi:hypothetical protein
MSIIRVATLVAAIGFASLTFAQEPKSLTDARLRFEKGTQTEVDRSKYVTELVRLREALAREKDDAWKLVDAEIMRHPVPADSTSLSKRMIGQWRSPRHDYEYRRNGTWTMLPVEPDTTKGTWRIKDNHVVETNVLGTFQYTILLLTAKDFVETDGQTVFYRTRIEK